MAQDKLEILTRRIEELERQQNEFYLQASESNSKINSFLRDNLTLGGFFESAFTAIDGEGTHLQASNSSNTLGLNLAADYSPSLRFVAQTLTGLNFNTQNSNNDPRAVNFGQPATREFRGVNFGAVVSQGYVSYSLNDRYTLLGGIGYVPFGHYPQQRELVLFVRRNGPQLLRTTNLFAPLFNGLNLQARFDRGSSLWGYNIYSFNRLDDPRTPGIGTRTWWASADDALRAGLSYQTAKFTDKMEHIAGADLRLTLNKFILTTEYARHFIPKRDDTWTYYVEPSVFIYAEDVLLYAFFDYASNPENKTGSGLTALSDPYKRYEYGGGVNWLPTSYTRIRAGLAYYDYRSKSSIVAGPERDFYSLDLSVGVAF